MGRPDHAFPPSIFVPLSSLTGERGTPLKLEVTVTPSDEVYQLRARVQELETALEDLRKEYNRVEYLYRCECIISMRLGDRCRENKINIRDILRGVVDG